VGGRARAVLPAAGEADDLLPLALSRPREALAKARVLLGRRPAAREASVAHQAVGIVLREFGDVNAGVRELRKALHLARQTGSAAREADVLAALGVGMVYAGRTRVGIAMLDQAVRMSSGVLAARVRVRRGIVLWTLGRYPAAMADARAAVGVLRRAGDQLWTARALNTRALVHLALGSTSRADADFAAAGRLFGETGQELEAIYAVLNRASVAFSAGDLPAALFLLDEAGTRWRPLGVPALALSIDRCAVLLAAGLVGDALAEADTAVRDMERIRGRSTKKAELLLMAANCALAAAQPATALDWAQAAHRLFRSQHSTWWRAHAARAVVQARYSAGLATMRLLTQASKTSASLDSLGSTEAAQAHLVAGRVALQLGRHDLADRHFAAAAQRRHSGSALSRATGWLGAALRAQAAGRPRQLLAACRAGLAVLDEHQYTLGGSELRVQATAHGAELAALAQRHALLTGRPRLLLTWSERWRATALAVPPVRPSPDARLNADLAALRAVTKRLDIAASQGVPSAPFKREQQRLESAVRARALRGQAAPGAGSAAFSAAALLDQLGSTRLIEITEIDGTLCVLICGAGRVRQFTAGRSSDAARAADFARFALRRLARGRPDDDLDSAQAILRRMGPRLQDALLGAAAGLLGDGPVVVIPPSKLYSIPWPLLPALRDRVVSVAPSAAAWMRAHSTQQPARHRVTLALGPGLSTEGAEIPAVAPLYDDVTVLAGHQATSQNVLSALDGAWLAHIAAHGVFRADSPLFSSLRLHDGPLTVYDFEQLRRAPYRLVLSSCDSAQLTPAGSGELLGLVSSLLPLGTAGILAAVVPLNDRATVPMMVDLHRQLRAGNSLAESMCVIRCGNPPDPAQQAAAISLLTLGAA
jgi:tetratricopeptide (TPR) repeat protein